MSWWEKLQRVGLVLNLIVLLAAAAATLAGWIGHLPPIFGQLPTDTVIIVDDDSCPAGWSPFEPARNRFIVGAGSEHAYRSTGGASTVVLEQPHLPPHRHQIETFEWGMSINANGAAQRLDMDDGPPWNGLSGRLTTTATGQGEAHENLPPFVAMSFCRSR